MRFFIVCGVMICFFFFSSRRRHTRCSRDWSSDVCSSDLYVVFRVLIVQGPGSASQRKAGHCGEDQTPDILFKSSQCVDGIRKCAAKRADRCGECGTYGLHGASRSTDGTLGGHAAYCCRSSRSGETPRSRTTTSSFEEIGRCAERSEEHTSELQSRLHLVCRLL